jgi:phosphoribosylanthranilate isomerase
MSVKIKICGITNVADARAAVDAGADLLGFVFYEKSPRHVTVQAAKAIARQLPPYVAKVGVFVNAPDELISQALGECGLSVLQFHGDETPEDCVKFGVMSMKAFRVRDEESLKALPAYQTDAWLLDAYTADARGGTGATFNWDLAVEAMKFGRPIFLAGGLTPENVAQAVRKVQPFAVDVSSGVEASPGKKDHGTVREFIQNVRTAMISKKVEKT